MTNQVQTRVLAYQMAREITEEEIKEVSGGAQTCSHPTLQASGAWPSQLDACIDFSIDM